MNWKRVGRLLVCLVLVAALLVQVSPIRAKAVSPGFVYVAAGAVIMGILWGVGVSAGVNGSEAFLDVCNDALNGLTLNYDFITDDQKIKAWATGNPDMPWMIDQSIIEALFGWAWDNEVVTGSGETLEFEGISAGLGNSASLYWAGSNYSISSDIPFAAYKVALYWESQYGNYHPSAFLVFTDDTGYYTSNGSTRKISSYAYRYGDMYIVHLGSWSSHKTLDDYNKCTGFADLGVQHYSDIQLFFEHFGGAVSSGNSVSTDKDLTLGEVAPAGTPIPDGYSIWNDNAILVEDDDGSHYVYPLTLPADFEDIKDLSQGDIWEGIGSTYEDTTTDTETGSGTGTGTGSGTTAGTAADIVTGVVSGLQDQTAQIGVWLGELIAGVQAIPQAIADVLTAIFVPSADYVTAKVESLRARFPFISSVISTGESLRDSISGSSGPPAIYVDLGRASSGNYGSQKVLLTDFAWYAEYKPTVDAVLSAALWAFFGWRVFLKLPGIISGESGVVGDISARAETYNKIKAGPPSKK